MTRIEKTLDWDGSFATPCPFGHNSAPEVGADLDHVGSEYCMRCENFVSQTDMAIICKCNNHDRK